MSLYDLLDTPDRIEGGGRRLDGVTVGIVTNNRDPDGMGRVKVRFPWLSDEDESQWARIAVPMAGAGRGIYFLPEVDDEVLVAFGHGDPRLPYVVGALWNGEDEPPEENSDGENDIRVIRSRSGHEIRFDDSADGARLEIHDGDGNSILLDTAGKRIVVKGDGDIEVSAESGTIRVAARSLELESSTDVKIKAGARMQLEAGATLSLQGALVDIN